MGIEFDIQEALSDFQKFNGRMSNRQHLERVEAYMIDARAALTKRQIGAGDIRRAQEAVRGMEWHIAELKGRIKGEGKKAGEE